MNAIVLEKPGLLRNARTDVPADLPEGWRWCGSAASEFVERIGMRIAASSRSFPIRGFWDTNWASSSSG